MRLLSQLTLTFLLLATSVPAIAAEREIEGNWSGALGGKLHVIVTFSKEKSGEYSGALNSVDQHATLPISKVSVKDATIHFEVPSVGGAYDGTLSADGKELTGKWTQKAAPIPQPLTLKRVEATSPAATESGPATKPITAPLDIHASISPVPFEAQGKNHLVYELHVTNMSPWNATLTKVEVLPEESGHEPLASWSGAALQLIASPVAHPDATTKALIGPGGSSVLALWVSLPAGKKAPALPKRLLHRLHLKLGTLPEELVVEGVPVSVSQTPALVISSPLQGDSWAAGNGPSNTSAHRRALIPIDGQAKIAQRFAIDWVRIHPDGKTYQGDAKDNHSYRAYGTEVHAVANGTVTAVKDGIPENVPGADSRAVPITLETIGGNHVLIDLGNGRFAFYAHLQPGSLKVKVGDKVRRGQVLGLLGNSGNSTEPHLHFQIADTNSPLGAEGLPYVLDRYEQQGQASEGDEKKLSSAPVAHERELPMEGEIVRFTSP